MPSSGTTFVDFGAWPGGLYVSTDVTGQAAIVGTSLVEAWVFPLGTADHSADEHLVDPPRVMAGDIVSASGFTIHAFPNESPPQIAVSGNRPGNIKGYASEYEIIPMHHGKYTIAWAWN